MEDDRPTFDDLYRRSTAVALVDVIAVAEGGRRIDGKVVEIYKGSLPNTCQFHMPTLWGKYASNWFKRGERSVVFSVDSDLTVFGRLGRMPLATIGGKDYVESFADDSSFFGGRIEFLEIEDRLFGDWEEFHDQLLKLSEAEAR